MDSTASTSSIHIDQHGPADPGRAGGAARRLSGQMGSYSTTTALHRAGELRGPWETTGARGRRHGSANTVTLLGPPGLVQDGTRPNILASIVQTLLQTLRQTLLPTLLQSTLHCQGADDACCDLFNHPPTPPDSRAPPPREEQTDVPGPSKPANYCHSFIWSWERRRLSAERGDAVVQERSVPGSPRTRRSPRAEEPTDTSAHRCSSSRILPSSARDEADEIPQVLRAWRRVRRTSISAPTTSRESGPAARATMVSNRIKNVGGSSSTCAPTQQQQQQQHLSRPARNTTPRLMLLLLALAGCFALSSASPALRIEDELVEVAAEAEAEAQSFLVGPTPEGLSRSGTILIDPSPPPASPDWALHLASAELRRRGETASESTAASGASATPSGLKTDESVSTEALPVPFDMGFNNNISTTCNSFMNSMLANSTFNKCLPFSLLLHNSNSFFQTSKSRVRITQMLDFSCAANVTQCTAVMSAFAANLTTSAACASDLSARNPLIENARTGLRAYQPLYKASCLRSPSTSAYCFANAITNVSSPSDSYIYFLPLNTSLVGGSKPTCNACLRNTMSIFEASSTDRTQALANTYVPAASQVNMICGPSFVNASLPAALESAALAPTAPPASLGAAALLTVLATWLVW
ncbi:hypothetical protein B2J93_9078 [Marssonina coronariae]|uniref:DUF7729 domain-containing protein n=1 Tax=Diplocarpon coronariae TaxID=2795749 RepID=A0A218YUA9_9HELO|nr:hypothetical protein B2J93_9078 [Marssonina coronariae]